MKPDLSQLNEEQLQHLLNLENLKFSHGIDEGLPFDTLRQIRQNIRVLREEIERRANSHSVTEMPRRAASA